MMYDRQPNETEDEYYARITDAFTESLQDDRSKTSQYLVGFINSMQASGLTRYEAIQFTSSFYGTFYVLTDPGGKNASGE